MENSKDKKKPLDVGIISQVVIPVTPLGGCSSGCNQNNQAT